MATPSDVAFIRQAKTINARLDRRNVPTMARRIRARKAGYRGPLTRAELAAKVRNAR